MLIPTCFTPYPDELWYGYQMRLAVANMSTCIDAFCKRYFDKSMSWKRGWRHQVDYPAGIAVMRERLDNLVVPDMRGILRMTPVYTMKGLLPGWETAKIVEWMLYGDIGITRIPVRMRKQVLNWCPECAEEDTGTYGEPFLHVSHNIHGVEVCHRHGRPLLHFDPLPGRYSLENGYIREGTPYEVEDGNKAMEYALEASFRCITEPDFPVVTCGLCGKSYPMHPWSVNTGAPCPYCLDGYRSPGDREVSPAAIRQIIQKRVDCTYPGEYSVISGTSVNDARMLHSECGTIKKDVFLYIWGKKRECLQCRKTTVRKVQKRADEAGTGFTVFRVRKEKKYRKIVFMHDCGRTFDIADNKFMRHPYCPYCDNRNGFRDLEEILPGYRAETSYRTSLDEFTVRHEECNTLFRSTKAILLNGRRCPVCEDKINMKTLKTILSEYAPSYSLLPADTAGTGDVYYRGELLKRNVRLQIIVNDLKCDAPVLLTDREKQYKPGLSLKRRILDSVRKATREKRFWTYSDGIDGETEITQYIRKTVWKMHRHGLLHSVEKGVYTADEEVFYDTDNNPDN